MLKKLIAVGIGALVLSGCALTPNTASKKTASPEIRVPMAQIQKGSLWKSSDSGSSFFPKSKVDEKTFITSADILSLAFDPTDSRIIYAGTIDNGIFRSQDGAETWENIPFPPKKIYSYILDHKNPQRMFASGILGNHGKVFRTDDGGASWKDVYTEPGENTVITAIAEHPVDTNVVFAGTNVGTVIKSTDGGNTWKDVGSQVNGPVTVIAFDVKLKFSVYLLVLSNKMYYSNDGGKKWQDWESLKRKEEEKMKLTAKEKETRDKKKAPDSPLSLSVSPVDSGVLYMANIGGLYKSTDYGKFWTAINIIESAGKFPIRAIALHPTDKNEMAFVSGAVFYKTKSGGVTWFVTPLNIDRGVSVLKYDTYDPNNIYFGLRKL